MNDINILNEQLSATKAELARLTQDINHKLAPGITFSLTLQGLPRFSVRVSKQGITGDSQRISLGTFTSYADALRAQIEYKLHGHLKVFPTGKLDEIIQAFKQEEILKLKTISASLTDSRASASSQLVSTLAEEVREQHSDAFQILSNVDFTLLDPTRPYNYSSQNGESLTIPANVVAAYFRYLETSPLDDFQS